MSSFFTNNCATSTANSCLCSQSLEVLLRHPEDNRNQIRELAQTLMDGGVLDELIQQKLDAFNARWDELMARVRRAGKAHVSLLVFHRASGQLFFPPK